MLAIALCVWMNESGKPQKNNGILFAASLRIWQKGGLELTSLSLSEQKHLMNMQI